MFIVTGGAGFIGSAFLRKLNNEGIKDILVVDNLGTSHKWKNLVGKSFREYMHKSAFLERLEKNQLPKGIDGIVHMGACSSTVENNLDYLMTNNFEFSRKLAEYAVAEGIRFVFASSAATYGNGESGYEDDEFTLDRLRPLNGYGFSKHLFDQWAHRNGLFHRIAGLKFFNVYGPNEFYKGQMSSVVWKAYQGIESAGSFSLFKSYRPDFKDGEQKRDFVYVKDCCEVMWWLLNDSGANGLFNLGSGKARTWLDLLRAVYKGMKRPEIISFVDMPPNLRDQYQYFTEAPMEKLRIAGYKTPFHSLESGIEDYVTNHLLMSDKHW